MRVFWARAACAALIVAASAPASMVLGIASGGTEAHAQSVVRSIQVRGNRRVEPETVRSYLQISPGDYYDPYKVDESLKALFATGLFTDVDIRLQGTTVVITVVENAIINRVAFEVTAKSTTKRSRPRSNRSSAPSTHGRVCRRTSSASSTSIAGRASTR